MSKYIFQYGIPYHDTVDSSFFPHLIGYAVSFIKHPGFLVFRFPEKAVGSRVSSIKVYAKMCLRLCRCFCFGQGFAQSILVPDFAIPIFQKRRVFVVQGKGLDLVPLQHLALQKLVELLPDESSAVTMPFWAKVTVIFWSSVMLKMA